MNTILVKCIFFSVVHLKVFYIERESGEVFDWFCFIFSSNIFVSYQNCQGDELLFSTAMTKCLARAIYNCKVYFSILLKKGTGHCGEEGMAAENGSSSHCVCS